MKQLETVRIPVHSMIDLITNSSTEIFVDCTGSVQPAKDLLQELLKLNGSDKTVDEVFDVTLEVDRYNLEIYIEYNLEDDDDEWERLTKEYKIHEGKYEDTQKELKRLVQDYLDGKVEIDIDSYHVQKFLKVTSKDKKYNHLLKLLDKFLNSPHYYEYNTG